jgi:GTP-binding protein
MEIVCKGSFTGGLNMFIDKARIFIKAGDGGNGLVAFRREKYIAAGGPNGGDGGKGGDIIFTVNQGLRTLVDFRYKKHYKAESGENGGSFNKTGRSGKDLVIQVPPGTIVKDELTGQVIADFTEEGQTMVIAKGGKGGRGNQHFATPTRQVPNFAENGDAGEERWIILELKLLADVGLVGFPNAGKSTILLRVSSAKPKIADYPFTTLKPNLGVVNADKENSFVIADIPGLIEGAHTGTGLGHEFLKHIERTRMLIHVIDIAAIDGRDPIQDFQVINNELAQYNPDIIEKYQVVAANKIDLPGVENNLEKLTKYAKEKGYQVFPISAATGKGIRELMFYVSQKLKELPVKPLISDTDKEVVYSVKEEQPFTIRKEGSAFIVEGEWVRKIISSTNIDSYDSMQYFQRAIKNIGIIKALEDLGINEGDTVKVYDIEFEYIR